MMTKRVKDKPEEERADSSEHFNALLSRVLTVSKQELTRREAAYQEARQIKKSARSRRSS